MKIKKIELKNFKFHQNLDFEIKKQNCLIYGENGTGKSSIYEALNAIFTIYYRNSNFSIKKFKNHISTEALSAKVIFDDTSELLIPKENIPLMEGKKTIYFANQDLLESIILNINFYDTIKNSFKNTFPILHNFRKNFEFINSSIDSSNYQEKNTKRQDNINKMERFLWRIELRANDILNNYFEEDFEISFEYIDTPSDNLDDIDIIIYPTPKIILKIDNKNKLKLNFNEAKLKLTSIAIFFALIKLEEGEDNNNPLKLLVLDDFLTSLDMANRHYIIEYILSDNGFKDYQKIILTHNLQFYNLILDWLNTHDETLEWDIKNLYTRQIGLDIEEAVIYPIDADYLDDAEKKLNEGEFQNAGNLIRKEFERVIHELEKFYKLGKKEESDTIVSYILNEKPIYAKQNQLFQTIKSTINYCKNIQDNEQKRTQKLTELYEKLKSSTSHQNTHLKAILKNLVFYRKILMNKSSHDNPDAEIYQKEYQSSILVMKELNKLLKNLKADK